MAYLLEPLGFTDLDNAVYLALVDAPRSSAAELAGRTGAPIGPVRRAVAALVDAGLATKVVDRPTRYLPTPPDVAVETLVAQRKRELQDLRDAASEFARRLEAPSTGPAGVVELIEGDEAIQHHLAQSQRDARREVLIIDTPPYLQGAPVQNAEELETLARGVGYRCIYDRQALATPGHFDQVSECIRAGEQARTLTAVSMKMQIVDREVAFLPVSFTPTETSSRLMVRTSPMLDALLTCFESLWRQAVPIGLPAAPEPSDRDQALLTLLATGMKDRVIAQTLGITERTLSRRVRELMVTLEADTRFQAGIQAAHLGLLRASD
ncbi:helix-turn-helix domain-containing protein [Lentzea sp. NPDC051838]|uniref:helix-turn-helix domain-containing protein n=1 Tax=Lentzea sp. NPDC051838 TaxID=3154849 RepID=UPI0034447AE4